MIYIHGDALLLQSSEGPHTYRAVALTGATATAAGFMVSVRAATGLALLRLWLESHEEAEQLAEQIGVAGRASEALVQRKALPTTSTWRRQLGRVAESLCNATMQLPLKVRRSVPKCGCWERKLKVRRRGLRRTLRLEKPSRTIQNHGLGGFFAAFPGVLEPQDGAGSVVLAGRPLFHPARQPEGPRQPIDP